MTTLLGTGRGLWLLPIRAPNIWKLKELCTHLQFQEITRNQLRLPRAGQGVCAETLLFQKSLSFSWQ